MPFLIVDPNDAQTCSKAAAGLITPVTGRRLTLSWRIEQCLPEAIGLYQELEALLGARFWHPLRHLRLFREPEEVAYWKSRAAQSPWRQDWVEESTQSLQGLSVSLLNDHGGFWLQNAGWLDTTTYLEASRVFFQKSGSWRQGNVAEEEIEVTTDGVSWQGETFDRIVLCRGWQQQGSQYFSWLTFQSARGIMMDLETAGPLPDHAVSKRCWMLPKDDHRFLVGSTYEFDWERPMEESLEELHSKLREMFLSDYRVTATRAGIRPIVKRMQLVLGRHPSWDRLAVFNGLGSKGALRAPYFAKMLAEHLLDGKPIDAEVDVRGNKASA